MDQRTLKPGDVVQLRGVDPCFVKSILDRVVPPRKEGP